MPALMFTNPCDQCPFRRSSAPGYLGDDTPEHFLRTAYRWESLMPCHTKIDYSDPDWLTTQFPGAPLCAGQVILFRNDLKMPRRVPLYEAYLKVRASSAVFRSPLEFLRHHLPGLGQSELIEVTRRVVSYETQPGDEPE